MILVSMRVSPRCPCGQANSSWVEATGKWYSTEVTLVGNIPLYSVAIRARVARDQCEPNPHLKVEIHLDRGIYYYIGSIDRNDVAHFSITASEGRSLFLFGITANDSVMLLLPTRV